MQGTKHERTKSECLNLSTAVHGGETLEFLQRPPSDSRIHGGNPFWKAQQMKLNTEDEKYSSERVKPTGRG